MQWRDSAGTVQLFPFQLAVSLVMAKHKLLTCESDCIKPKRTPFWKDGLKAAIDDPKVQLFTDDRIVIIKDKYPKVGVTQLLS